MVVMESIEKITSWKEKVSRVIGIADAKLISN
jgi:hypothetical protein